MRGNLLSIIKAKFQHEGNGYVENNWYSSVSQD